MEEVVSLSKRSRDEMGREWIRERGDEVEDEIDSVGGERMHDDGHGTKSVWYIMACVFLPGLPTPLVI